MKSAFTTVIVAPAKAGVQGGNRRGLAALDSRFPGKDEQQR
jgi:hypothetical protein